MITFYKYKHPSIDALSPFVEKLRIERTDMLSKMQTLYPQSMDMGQTSLL